MKKFIALAVLATTTASFAADRKINDLMYLPNAGTTYGITEAAYIKRQIDFDGQGDASVDGYGVNQAIGHSFTDRFSVSAAINYLNASVDYGDGFTGDYDTKGISDPTIQAKFRMMDETFRWDILGGAVISLRDSEIDSDGDRSNNRGGNSLYVGTQFGATNEYFQWSILGQLNHNMKATTDDKVNDVKTKDDANNELLIRGEILNKLASDSYLHSNLSVEFDEEYDDNQDGSTPSSTLYNIGTEYQQILSQDLMLRAGIDYFVNNTNTGSIDSDTGWQLTFGANYQF